MVYEFDNDRNMNLVRESMTTLDDCLCANNHVEQSILSLPLTLPATRRTDFDIGVYVTSARVSIEAIRAYHIIPLQLITRFFELWLSNELSSYSNNDFNGCVRTLFGRLKRSMLKILLVSMKKSRVFSDQFNPSNGNGASFNPDDTLSIQSIREAISWLSGNIFIGPFNRGPFDPTFQRYGDELFEAFDYSAEPIVGPQRFEELKQLFLQLREFVRTASRKQPFTRLMQGFNLFIKISVVLGKYRVTSMTDEQWEDRPLSYEELQNLRTGQLMRQFGMKKYWTVKKQFRRDPRSVNSYKHEEKSMSSSGKDLVKNIWTEFVLIVISISMKARIRSKPLDWMCSFDQLYDDYFFHESISKDDKYSNCLSFDDFLYTKISSSKEWSKCNHNKNLPKKPEWCSAWRRIVKDLNPGYNYSVYEDPKSYIKGEPKWKFYSKDIGTVVTWLSSKSNASKGKTMEYPLIKFSKNPYQPRVKSKSVLDIALCRLATLGTILFTWNECNKILG